jgi:hypothetical protein
MWAVQDREAAAFSSSLSSISKLKPDSTLFLLFNLEFYKAESYSKLESIVALLREVLSAPIARSNSFNIPHEYPTSPLYCTQREFLHVDLIFFLDTLSFIIDAIKLQTDYLTLDIIIVT